MAEKSLAKSALEFLNNVFLERDPRNSILDPMTCIVRLGILGFKDCGTKVSVADNSIKFNNPNIFQGAKRWSMGDNREDLHNIYNPIKKIVSWFNLNSPEIYGIIKFAIRGIHLLKSSYNQNSIVSHTLNLYIQELEIALQKAKLNITPEILGTHESKEGSGYGSSGGGGSRTPKTRRQKRGGYNQHNQDREAEPEVDKEAEAEVESESSKLSNSTNSATNQNHNFFLEIEQEVKNKHIYDFFRSLWNENEITICYNLLLEMSKCKEKPEELDNYIRSLDAILSMKEQKTKDLLTETSTILE